MMKSPKPCTNFKGAFGTDVAHATLIAAKLTAALKIEPWKMSTSAHNVKALIYQVVVTTWGKCGNVSGLNSNKIIQRCVTLSTNSTLLLHSTPVMLSVAGEPMPSSSIIKPRLTKTSTTMTLHPSILMSTRTVRIPSDTQKSSLNQKAIFPNTLVSQNAPSSNRTSSTIQSYLSDTTTSWRFHYAALAWKQKWKNLCLRKAMSALTRTNSDRSQARAVLRSF